MKNKILRLLTWLFLLIPVILTAQNTQFSRETQKYILYDAPVLALTGVRVIVGDGITIRPNQAVIIKEGRILDIGDSDKIRIPEGAEHIDLTGKTVLPGFIMFHEHLFYPAGGGQYNQQLTSFPKLYLAGGVTTIRTTGSIEPYADLNVKRAIIAGRIPGPKMDVTGPFLNGPGLSLLQVKSLKGPEDARAMVDYWAAEGIDSFKVYAQISAEELRAVAEEAHKRGKKVTGHLGSLSYREAADLDIDNIEHGFFQSTDFIPDPNDNPSGLTQRQSLLALDPEGPEVESLIEHLVRKGVAITSTLPVFEAMVPGRPPLPDEVLDAMLPESSDQYLLTWQRIAKNPESDWPTLFKIGMDLEKKFFEAGGLLLVGTDPTGYGGVVAGYSNLRAIELLVEAGLSPLDALRVATFNGARYLEREGDLGTVEIGKIADLVIVDGDPSSQIQDIRNITIVFKDGIGYDSRQLFASVKGTIGLR
jgi:imidazolonepropionase-like amidohydrolase